MKKKSRKLLLLNMLAVLPIPVVASIAVVSCGNNNSNIDKPNIPINPNGPTENVKPGEGGKPGNGQTPPPNNGGSGNHDTPSSPDDGGSGQDKPIEKPEPDKNPPSIPNGDSSIKPDHSDSQDEIPQANPTDGNIFVSHSDINNIPYVKIVPNTNNTQLEQYIKDLIKNNKKLFFKEPLTITESDIDKATISNIKKNSQEEQISFDIIWNKQPPKTFIIYNVTFTKSDYNPIPDSNNLFVKNDNVNCIDVPPVPDRFADNAFWVKGLISQNKGWFFSNPNIPDSVVTNAKIDILSSDCNSQTYTFDIKATYNGETSKKQFKLVNLNLCKEISDNGKLVIVNNPNGYSTNAPAFTKETAIIKNDQITYPTANFLELDVWSNSDSIDKFSVQLNTKASEVFLLDATGFCNPKPLEWAIATEYENGGFILKNNMLSNINPLVKDQTQSVRLVSTISENNKQTKHIDVKVNFHLGLAQPTQPEQPNEPGLQTTVSPKQLKSTWAECLNHAHVNKGVKVDINKLIVEASNEYISQQTLSFKLNTKASEVFDLNGTNFSDAACVEWNVKDDQNSVFAIVNEGKTKEFRNFAPIIGPDGVSTILTATIKEANKATKYVDILVVFRGNGPCEAKPTLDYSEIAIATPNVDFFTLPGKDPNVFENRITIPSTANHGIKQKYGNAPLPWKDDSALTNEDLMNMFSYLALNDRWSIDLTFGERRIETNRMAAAYFQWLRTTWWKYFPYYSFANPNRIFGFKTAEGVSVLTKIPNTEEWVNNKKWYVDTMQKGTYASEWLKDTQQRQDFYRYIGGLLTQIRPGMSDLDKFFVCWRYIDNWTYYDKSTPTGVSSNHNGVCIDYASNLALLLNIAGIDAVPNTCGEDALGQIQYQQEAQSHGMTFVYMDIGDGEKKWYGSDPTFSDTWGSSNISTAKAPYSSQVNNTSNILFDLIAENSNTRPPEGTHYQQYFGNQFFGLPWNYVWHMSDNKTIGNFSKGSFNWAKRSKWINDASKFKISNLIFNNGKWYFFKKPIKGTQEEFVCINNLFDTTFNVSEKLPSNFLFSQDQYRPILLNSFNNWALFPAHYNSNHLEFNVSKPNSIAFVKMTDTGFDFNNIHYIPINDNNPNSGNLLEYYVTLDGKLHVFSSDSFASNEINVSKVIDLKNDHNDLWKQMEYSKNNQPSNEILLATYNYFYAIAGVYKLGNKDGQATLADKKAYFNQINNIFKSSVDNWNKLVNFKKAFDDYVTTTLRATHELFVGSFLNPLYLISKDLYKYSGIKLNLPLYLDPDEIANGSSNTTYEFYYQKDGSNDFTYVCTASEPCIKPEDFKKAGFVCGDNGTLKVRYYQGIHKDKAIEATTKIIFTDNDSNNVVDTTTLPYVGFYHPNDGFQTTNYRPSKIGWENDEIIIKFNDFGLFEMQSLNPKFAIKKINPSNMQIETIESNLDATQIKKFEKKYGDVSDSNHGIYWVEITYNYQNQQIKMLSPFTFIFTQNDIDKFDSVLWNKAINLIADNK